MSVITIPVVAGVLVRDGRIFIAKRNPGGSAGGKWEFPGGKVESDEEPRSALARELREELNLAVTVGDSLGCFETLVSGRVIALDCYWVTDAAGEIALTSHSECRWVDPQDLKSVDFAEPDLPVIDKIINYLPPLSRVET